MISKQDVHAFEDLLRSVSSAKKGYLMINSPGGDANAAEKLLIMCRERFTEEFNIIVPDYAKSAATMIVLGSDKILMGYLAELGPIDPQLQLQPVPVPGGTIPARSFIDGLNMIRDRVVKDGDPVQIYLPMLSQIRPEVVAMSQRAIEDAETLARKWLEKYMLKDDPEQAKNVARWLSSGEMYKSHGKVIDFQEAKSVLKLNVEKIDPTSMLWSEIWELYCRSTHFLSQRTRQGAAKLFESESVSFTISVQALLARAPSPPQPMPPPPQPAPGEPTKPQPGKPPTQPSSSTA